MPQFGELLKSLAGKAGIKVDDETLKKLLSFTEVAQLDLPEPFSKALEANLLTLESAAANTDLRGRLFAEALNGVDAEIDKTVNDFGFDDGFKNEYKSIQKNTNEKIRRVSAGLKKLLDEAKTKAAQSKDPKDQQEVQTLKKEIEQLNASMENLKTLHSTEKQNLVMQNLNDKKEFTLRSALAGKPLPKNGLSPDINILTAKTLVQQEMAKHGLQVLFDDAGNPILKQRKDGTDIDYFVDNKKVDFSPFIDGVLAQNKFVQINDQQNQNNNGSGNTPATTAAAGTPVNQAIVQETAQLLEMLNTGAQV